MKLAQFWNNNFPRKFVVQFFVKYNAPPFWAMFESKISWFSVSLNSIVSDYPKQIPPPLFKAVQLFIINPENVKSLF